MSLLAIASLVWAALLSLSMILVRRIPILERIAPAKPASWPKISVIVPACNEAVSIDGAMRSRLKEEYPNVEYILVDDRSTDQTGAIIDQLASEDARVRAVHITELPSGWLGKLHAMKVGLENATGEWILFSDADVHHEPGALKKILAWAEQEARDHVAVFPSVWPKGAFGIDIAMSAFIRTFSVISRAWKVADDSSRVAIGGGVFNLVRRSALEKAGGLEPLKLEVCDDVALGQMLKWSGARAGVLNARNQVGLYFYESLGEAVRGMEKNAFAVMGRFEVVRFLLTISIVTTLEFGSYGALAFGAGWVRIVAGVAIALSLFTYLASARWLGRPQLPAFFGPLGFLVVVFASVRSMILTMARGGISWRGTRYSLAELREGRRLQIS